MTLRAEELGYVLTLVPELYLNDIKGEKAPALDAWSIANGLAAITKKIEILAALRPQYHQVALTAKQIATISQICGGRFSINMVSAWWAEEARQYGISFDGHDDRYALTHEYTDVLKGFWSKSLLIIKANTLVLKIHLMNLNLLKCHLYMPEERAKEEEKPLRSLQINI